ncbi:(2Fe-2S)-binding protein [Mycolicibacterium vaccae]|uniref:(2Fe-2S)-binding protein n=1 Tax=Mycolicibacterium vaccae TaxID=1810 RepID=UPI003D015E51
MRIDAELCHVSGHGGFFAIRTGPPGPGYRSTADGFADLIASTAQRTGAPDLRTAASLVQMSVASRLWSPAIACATAFGVVPDFTGLYRADDSAELLLCRPTGVRAHRDEDLAGLLYTHVVERTLEPLAAGLPVPIAPGLLAGNVASALVGAARAWGVVRPDLCAPAVRLTHTLLRTGQLRDTGKMKGDLDFRRRSCCLYYRVAAGAKCADCGI